MTIGIEDISTEEAEKVLHQIRQNLRVERNILQNAHLLPDMYDTKQALAQTQVCLTVTERAWNRLPPLMSNRSGSTARVELWAKRLIKRLTHWFTWEQVNFNAVVNKALRAITSVLTTHDKQHAEMQLKIEELTTKIEELSVLKAELEALRRSERTNDEIS